MPDLETLSSLDPFVLLASAAQPTTTIRLGTDVLIVPYAEIGVTSFVMNALAGPDRMLPTYEAFAREVIPHFRD